MIKQITVNPLNEELFSADFTKGFNCGAKRQFQADVEAIAKANASKEIEWIPVSEALPSEGQVVLAIGDKGTWDVGKFQGTAGWTNDERMWFWKHKSTKRVEYWMPKDAIPLPNRGEEE